MRGLAGWTLLSLTLAGCAGEPGAMGPPPEPVDGEGPEGPARAPIAPLVWQTLWEGDFALTPATPIRGPVTIPAGTLQVLVNLTTDGGAAYGLQIELGECHWKRDLAILSQGGETWGADCGGLLPGSADLVVATRAGALAGRGVVVAVTCDARAGICPAPLPPTNSAG